jgi:thioesterase domain-containing protein
MIVRLRRGSGPALFVFAGAGGSAEELRPLAEALPGDTAVVGLEPFGSRDGPDRRPASVEEMTSLALEAVKTEQPDGPYRLLGYSFGGVLALELGDRLRAQGDAVTFVGLVDAIYDRRYWPTLTFASAALRRTGKHLRAMIVQRPPVASAELRLRLGRLFGIVASRSRGTASHPTTEEPDIQSRNLAVLAAWRPRPVAGAGVLFTSGRSEDFGCDPASLWEGLIEELEVVRVPGSHLGIVREADSIRALAEAVDAKLADGRESKLRVLLATTFAWESACRLAVELAEAGCAVEAVAPPNSFLHRLKEVARSYRLGLVRPEKSLRRALLESDADLVIPFDDRTRHVLHRVYDEARDGSQESTRLRRRIVQSLGPADVYPRVFSRASIMGLAAEQGFSCPPTTSITSRDELLAWMDEHGPAVLKTDGSWGGREVAVASDADEAARAWARLSRPPGWSRIVKRFLVDRDPWPLRERLAGRSPTISAQVYVEGEPANIAAACLDGELLGAVQARVVRSNGTFGPSTVIRVTEHPQMLAIARGLVRELRLTGLCGLDFVIEPETDRANLIELNARATPTAHLVAADGADLLVSLRDALGHHGPPARTRDGREELIALFPQELQRDPASPFLTMAHHDVPTRCPELVEHVMADGNRPFLLRGRLAVRLWPT